jgi:hypothetical protein
VKGDRDMIDAALSWETSWRRSRAWSSAVDGPLEIKPGFVGVNLNLRLSDDESAVIRAAVGGE